MFRALSPLLAVALLAVADAEEEKKWNAITDRAFGKKYTSTIDFDIFSQTPKWEDDAENPPISPRKAIKLASEMRDSIAKAPDGWKWKPFDLSLSGGTQNRWYWTVSFKAISTPNKRSDKVHFIRLLVYMDGTVVEPSVRDDDSLKKSQD